MDDNTAEISNRNIVLILCFVIILPTVGANYEFAFSNITTFWSWVSYGDWQEMLKKNPARFWSNIVSALAAVFGLGFIVWQLRSNAIQARRLKTYEIAGKIQNIDFLDHISRARGFLGIDESKHEDAWERYNEGKLPKIAPHVYISLAYFEDMAMLYNRNYIDRDLIKSLLRVAINDFYKESKWFRDKSKEIDKESYIEFDRMCKDLHS